MGWANDTVVIQNSLSKLQLTALHNELTDFLLALGISRDLQSAHGIDTLFAAVDADLSSQQSSAGVSASAQDVRDVPQGKNVKLHSMLQAAERALQPVLNQAKQERPANHALLTKMRKMLASIHAHLLTLASNKPHALDLISVRRICNECSDLCKHAEENRASKPKNPFLNKIAKRLHKYQEISVPHQQEDKGAHSPQSLECEVHELYLNLQRVLSREHGKTTQHNQMLQALIECEIRICCWIKLTRLLRQEETNPQPQTLTAMTKMASLVSNDLAMEFFYVQEHKTYSAEVIEAISDKTYVELSRNRAEAFLDPTLAASTHLANYQLVQAICAPPNQRALNLLNVWPFLEQVYKRKDDVEGLLKSFIGEIPDCINPLLLQIWDPLVMFCPEYPKAAREVARYQAEIDDALVAGLPPAPQPLSKVTALTNVAFSAWNGNRPKGFSFFVYDTPKKQVSVFGAELSTEFCQSFVSVSCRVISQMTRQGASLLAASVDCLPLQMWLAMSLMASASIALASAMEQETVEYLVMEDNHKFTAEADALRAKYTNLVNALQKEREKQQEALVQCATAKQQEATAEFGSASYYNAQHNLRASTEVLKACQELVHRMEDDENLMKEMLDQKVAADKQTLFREKSQLRYDISNAVSNLFDLRKGVAALFTSVEIKEEPAGPEEDSPLDRTAWQKTEAFSNLRTRLEQALNEPAALFEDMFHLSDRKSVV